MANSITISQNQINIYRNNLIVEKQNTFVKWFSNLTGQADLDGRSNLRADLEVRLPSPASQLTGKGRRFE